MSAKLIVPFGCRFAIEHVLDTSSLSTWDRIKLLLGYRIRISSMVWCESPVTIVGIRINTESSEQYGPGAESSYKLWHKDDIVHGALDECTGEQLSKQHLKIHGDVE